MSRWDITGNYKDEKNCIFYFGAYDFEYCTHKL